MDWHKIRLQIISVLKYNYSAREAENIANYYVDAKRGETLNLEAVEKDINLLKEGSPVQYVTGKAFFYNNEFEVSPAVLIPRPETEELVDWIIKDWSNAQPINIMDVGVGSGCILLSILDEVPYSEAIGLDISNEALEIFIRNAKVLGHSCTCLCMDILSEEPSLKLDVIVSNPPYILNTERERMDASVIIHEPAVALFVDNEDPLTFYKSILSLAESLLNAKGKLYFETSDLYHDSLEKLLKEKQVDYEFRKDMQGNWRMLRVIFD